MKRRKSALQMMMQWMMTSADERKKQWIARATGVASVPPLVKYQILTWYKEASNWLNSCGPSSPRRQQTAIFQAQLGLKAARLLCDEGRAE